MKAKQDRTKLHCTKCGKLTNGKLGFLNSMPEEGDTPEQSNARISFFRPRTFFKVLMCTGITLPDLLFGICSGCKTQTWFTINKNRNLQVINHGN